MRHLSEGHLQNVAAPCIEGSADLFVDPPELVVAVYHQAVDREWQVVGGWPTPWQLGAPLSLHGAFRGP
eukprot:364411-Chlamydomonas_euryale.AAC.2